MDVEKHDGNAELIIIPTKNGKNGKTGKDGKILEIPLRNKNKRIKQIQTQNLTQSTILDVVLTSRG
jgi:hypothetical protein